MAAIKLEALPPEEAIEFFRQKGYKIGFDWRDVWQQEHQAAFTVAKAMRIDLLQDIRSAVDDALAGGTSFETFRKQLKPILVKKGWWGRADMEDPLTGEIKNVQLGSTRRLKRIYDTNLRTSHSEGQWERIQRSKTAFPYLQYDGNNSEHPRLQHAAWDGLVIPADDPWWQSHMPVKEWGCKCRVIQLSAGMLKRRGLEVSKAPVVPDVAYTNARTGEVQLVPKGVHPAFNYPPGGRLNNLPRYFTDRLDATHHSLAAVAVKDLVASEAFAAFYASPAAKFFPVGVVTDTDAAALGSKAHTVRLSDATMEKQLREHAEIGAAEYVHVQDAIDRGTRIEDGDALVYLLEDAGYVTVIKTTRTGKALYLTSFRRLSSNAAKRDREMKRLMGKGKDGR